MVQPGRLTLPNQLRNLRNERRLSQRELAKRAGLTDVTISRIEQSQNATHVTIETLERLANGLEVTTDTLLGRLPASAPLQSSAPLYISPRAASETRNPLSEADTIRVYAAYYGALLADTGRIVCAANMNNELVYANTVYEHIFGYTQAELMGKRIEDFIAASSHQLSRQMRADKLNGIPLTSYQITALTKAGNPFPLTITTQLIYHDGKPIGIQGIGGVVDPTRQSP